MMRLVSTLAAVWCLGMVPAAAQAPAPPPPAAAPTDNLPSPPADFTYDASGRRDPFMTLTRGVVPGGEVNPGSRPSGAAGLMVDELTVRGIVLTNGTYVAMLSGPGAGQTYSVRAGSRLSRREAGPVRPGHRAYDRVSTTRTLSRW